MTITDYNENAVKTICHDCNSPMAKRSFNFFRRMHYVTGGKVWSKVWSKDGDPVAFYYASRCRDHVRLVEIAVRSGWQGRGLGKMALADLVARTKSAGLRKITFRTPCAESAQGFWNHVGARIIDVKGSDYEMQLYI